MDRPPLEVALVVRLAATAFIGRTRQWIRWAHIKVLLAIARCRTAALGGHIDECTSCGHRATISYNSCRNRHCPKCQANARDRWLQARRQELLPTPYVHVVFPLPHQLAPLARQNRKLLYGLLFRARGEPLLEFARTPRHLGADLGFFSVLHTWNQKIELHPHVHCVVPAGGLSLDHTHWVPSRPPARVSPQVCPRPPLRLPAPPAPLLWRPRPPGSTQDLRCLAAAPLPKQLGGLLQAALRRPRVCAPVSGPLHPPHRHLQPSTRFVYGWPSYLSLARLGSPQ